MAGIGAKKWTNIYGSMLQVDNSNTGVDSTVRTIKDGAGNSSAVGVSQNKALIKPSATDSTTAFQVKNSSNNALLTVDTTNDKVLAGISQVPIATQYAYFGVNYIHSANWAANAHQALPFMNNGFTGALFDNVSFLTGTEPTLAYINSNADGFRSAELMPYLWYVMDDIVIEDVKHIQGGTAGAGSNDATRMHLMKYNYTTNNANVLTSGAVVANTSSDTSATDAVTSHLVGWDVVSAQKTVSAGQVIACTFRSDSINNYYSIQVVVKYRAA